MKIIVVDDEEDVRSLFKQKFRKEIKTGQIEFEFFFSAAAVLTYLETQAKEQVYLIVSDINMPGMNGIELLKIIKQKFTNIKVLMMTAYSDIQTQQTAFTHQADAYITKPVDFEHLKAIIFNFVNH